MSDIRYDTPINEVTKILDKSDRQVRRYVKEKRLKAKPVKVGGHIKLMFSKQDVETFKERFLASGVFGDTGNEIVIDAQYLETCDDDKASTSDSDLGNDNSGRGDSMTVKYVIDAMREQITSLQTENRELHYQLEQRSGQVGFLQGKVETLEQEIKMLAPVPTPEEEEVYIPWYKKIFGIG